MKKTVYQKPSMHVNTVIATSSMMTVSGGEGLPDGGTYKDNPDEEADVKGRNNWSDGLW